MYNNAAHYCQTRYNELKTDRCNFDDMWEDIARFIIPHRGGFNTKITQGSRNRKHILDSTGSWAADQLTNFLYGALTNPGTNWFGLGTYAADVARREDVRQYLDYCTNHILAIFNNPRKKFYDHSHEIYSDIVPFGTGVMFLEDRPGQGLSFRSRFLSECYFDEDYDGNIDVMARHFQMSLRQLAQQFGADNLPEDMQRALHKDGARKFDVLHSIYPNEDGGYSKTKMPYVSKYILLEKSYELKDGGFRRFPVLAPRWSKRSDEIYGRGPGSMALAEVRMIQKMKETTLKGGQKMVDPPLQVPDSSFLSPLNLTPGAINYYNPIYDNDGAKQIITNARPDFGRDLMNDEKEAILRSFYADKLASQKGANVEQTRTEFLGDQSERLMLMAPQLGRLHTEYLGPLVEQTFLVERFAGRLPDPPEALQGQALMVQYKSPLAKAQQMQRLQGVTGAVNDIVPLSQVFPEIMDSINPDGLSEWVFFSHDTPTNVLRPKDEVAKIREDRQKQAEMQQQLAMAEQGSKAAANVAKLQPKQGPQRVVS
jgi:hypothetical protein